MHHLGEAEETAVECDGGVDVVDDVADDAVAERFGLSITDLKTLDVLQRLGPLTAGDIAGHTKLASGSVTSLVDRLERRGLVRRTRDPAGDRRRVIVELTPRLGKTIAPLFASLNRRMLERFAAYGDREIETIREFLSRGSAEMRDETEKLRSTPPLKEST